MKRLIACLFTVFLIAAGDAFAQEGGASGMRPGFSVSVGGLGYGILGSDSVVTPVYRIKFEKDKLKASPSAGLEALFYFSDMHSISLGAYYEQRRIDLRIANMALFIPMTIALNPLLPSITLSQMPLEDFVKKTSLAAQYINIPLAYRFHPAKFFYVGLGFDFGYLLKAEAKYSVLMMRSMLDLKGHFKTFDVAGKVLLGFAYEEVFVELSAAGGLLDLDDFSGTRNSVYAKLMLGYRY